MPGIFFSVCFLEAPAASFFTMARVSRPILGVSVLAAAACLAGNLVAFVAPKAPAAAPRTALRARGGGEYDVSDADIEAFYAEVTSGSGGDVPKGNVVSELIVKFFHGSHLIKSVHFDSFHPS